MFLRQDYLSLPTQPSHHIYKVCLSQTSRFSHCRKSGHLASGCWCNILRLKQLWLTGSQNKCTEKTKVTNKRQQKTDENQKLTGQERIERNNIHKFITMLDKTQRVLMVLKLLFLSFQCNIKIHSATLEHLRDSPDGSQCQLKTLRVLQACGELWSSH